MNINRILVNSTVVGCVFAACFSATALAATHGTLNDSGVNVRAESNTSSAIVDKLNEGDMVEILDKRGNWFNVSYADKNSAYIYEDYIEITETDVTVIDEKVSLREAPGENTGKLDRLNKGDVVTAKGIAGDWLLVNSKGTEGYILANSVDGDYIDCLSEVDYATAVTEDYGFVTAVTGLNFRTEPTLDGDIISVLPYMTKAEIIDSDDKWVHILTDDGSEGYVSAEYFDVKTDEDSEEALTKGGQLINYAKQFLGTPYVWGGTDLSSGVDCSGFVYCVFKNAEGISLTRSSAGMAANDGYLIDKSELQAGDLVFFDNDGNGTIDHVGIYMYDGYYIHSSSGIKDGVIISTLSDPYGVSSFAYAKRVL